MQIGKSLREVVTSPYYRSHPIATAKYAYAKWLFGRHRADRPLAILENLGLGGDSSLDGFEKWRPKLDEVILRVRQREGHQGGASLEDGIILFGLVRELRPTYVIETGVAAGVTTSFIGAALIENGVGELYSIELPPETSAAGVHGDGATFDWPKDGVGWAIPDDIRAGLANRWTLILEDVRTALPRLVHELPQVDIFLHDDLHTPDHMLWEYELVWPHLRSGGVLISDDVNYSWVTFCRRQTVEGDPLRNIQRLAALRKPRQV